MREKDKQKTNEYNLQNKQRERELILIDYPNIVE